MGEPLNVTKKLGHPQSYFKRSEIESAVEWLKERLRKEGLGLAMNLVSKAFPDLQDVTIKRRKW